MSVFAPERREADSPGNRYPKESNGSGYARADKLRDIAENLSSIVMAINPEEFYWHDNHYESDSSRGRELLFLIAHHEWVRATSEIIHITRSDVIETDIKIDIDLGQITHEAFHERTGEIWLPVAVLPPLKNAERRLEPDPFATVSDAAGNLLPLSPAEDLSHQISAALAEIIVNMAASHSPDLSPSQNQVGPSRAPTRDQRVLLSAAIYRMMRDGETEGVDEEQASSVLETPRIKEAREGLLSLFSPYIGGLQKLARNEMPKDQFVPELAQRAIIVLEALIKSTVVVVPLSYDVKTTVLTVRVPARALERRAWAIRPSAHLDIDVLLPTADADRQVQIHLPDGMSFEERQNAKGSKRLPRLSLDVAVRTPQPLLELWASICQIPSKRWSLKVEGPPQARIGLIQTLVDLAKQKAAAAINTLQSYEIRGMAVPYSKLNELVAKLQSSAADDDTALHEIQQAGKEIHLDKLPLFMRTQVDGLSPRRAVARMKVIEEVAQRATPKCALVKADIKVDDRDYLSAARTSTLMSLILMIGVFLFLASWHFIRPTKYPAPEVLAIVLTLFVTIQASRIERPDSSMLRGQLAAIGSWLTAVSMLPAITLAIALAFQPGGLVDAIWAGACCFVQALLLLLMWRGPISPIVSADTKVRKHNGKMWQYKTLPLEYRHFEPLRSDYWRNTTAEALTIGRMAYGYVVWQEVRNRPGKRTFPPQLSPVLRRREGSAATQNPNSVLALLHSSTLRQAITFVVFREKPERGWLAQESVREKIPLDLDPDRLAPMDNVSSTVDIFVGVPQNRLPTVAQHPAISVMEAAEKKLIILEAQLPVPAPTDRFENTRWARIRVALRDTKDIGRLTGFLKTIATSRPQYPPHIIAVQAVPTESLRIIAGSRAEETLRKESENATAARGQRGNLHVGDVDIFRDSTESEPSDAHTWRMVAICADARSNIEADMIRRRLPFERSDFELVHLNYALLHGTAVLIMLVRAREAAGVGRIPPDGDPLHKGPGAGAIDLETRKDRPTWGQARILVNAELSREQLGSMAEQPLLRIRFRWQDRPGVLLHVLDSVIDALREGWPSSAREEYSVSFARAQVASGSTALGYLTVRVPPHVSTQGETELDAVETPQMARKISALSVLNGIIDQDYEHGGRKLSQAEQPVIRIDIR
jgi:hypothetical protein